MKTNLHKNIMRRVYYSYALSFVSEPMLWQGFILGACVALFGRLTHVAAIAHNFAATNINEAPSFIWHSFANAFQGGELLTVLVAVFIVGFSTKFLYRLIKVWLRAGRLQTPEDEKAAPTFVGAAF
jgi:hypothetical protein